MTPARATRRIIPGSPFNVPSVPAAPAQQFTINDRVTHDRHGLGTVVGVDEGTEVVVDFGSAVRRIALPSPKLTKL